MKEVKQKLTLDQPAIYQIKVPKVYLWQGKNDTSVPNTQARYLAEMLPNCQAIFMPNAGHLWPIDHMAEVLNTLVPDSRNLKDVVKKQRKINKLLSLTRRLK
jgi:hypothetical protein